MGWGWWWMVESMNSKMESVITRWWWLQLLIKRKTVSCRIISTRLDRLRWRSRWWMMTYTKLDRSWKAWESQCIQVNLTKRMHRDLQRRRKHRKARGLMNLTMETRQQLGKAKELVNFNQRQLPWVPWSNSETNGNSIIGLKSTKETQYRTIVILKMIKQLINQIKKQC